MKDILSKQSIEYNLCLCGCGQPCKNKYVTRHNVRGIHSPRYKNGRRISTHGYIQIRCENDPRAKPKNGYYLYEHRLVMEKHLGRLLSYWEDVHHINGNKQDNRIQNLQLIDKREHAALHARKSF